MEWTGVEFEIHGVKTQIHAPWPWKKFTVFGEIHKPPFRVKGHIYFSILQLVRVFRLVMEEHDKNSVT